MRKILIAAAILSATAAPSFAGKEAQNVAYNNTAYAQTAHARPSVSVPSRPARPSIPSIPSRPATQLRE